jgi:hypothetical protein
MSKLIDKLKSDHRDLVKILEEVKKLGVTPAGLAKLKTAKAGLLAHLKHEDVELYPKLRNAAKSDPTLKSMLDLFAKEMEGITTFALNFFNKYENAKTDVGFAKDFGKLLGELGNRIRREETLLYEAYEKIEKKGGRKAA